MKCFQTFRKHLCCIMGALPISLCKSPTTRHHRSMKFISIDISVESGYGARHTQIILLFLLITISYLMRINMSVAIVAMTDEDSSPNPEVPTYNWDDKSIILTAFFVGYIIPQVPAGQLAKNYGPKWFLALTFAIGSLLAILTPVIARLGSSALITCRILQGIAQGFIFPSSHNLLSKWVPPCERARLSTLVYAGVPVGSVLAMTITGWLSGSWLGWPYAFYLFGAVGLLWTMLWIAFGKNSPADHTGIDPYEKFYIETSLGQTVREKSPATPWKEILTSLPVWGLAAAYSAQNWGFSTLITNIPSYMAKILNFDIKSNGILSAGPYLVFWAFSIVISAATDFSITHQYVTVGAARKITNSIVTTVVLLFIAVGANGSSYSGYRVNHMDLSLTYSGTLMGVTNGIANLSSIIAPLLLQFVVTDETKVSNVLSHLRRLNLIRADNWWRIRPGTQHQNFRKDELEARTEAAIVLATKSELNFSIPE
ncbi:hypothetical protein RI129_010387 [Pyrocoelia pectoralis]|uniref:Major facilitator superfamily (MFS) profile domain-containing protein n=1 Tax=Pyrocoelia pectoralis TaxID=417401 RepID=A0AAN7ZD88_9COLE